MPATHVVCAILEHQQQVLVAQRPEGKRLAGFWEFPGGKIEPGESPEAALHREIAEELGCQITVVQSGPPVPYGYEWGEIVLHPFRCQLTADSPPPTAHEHAALDWRPAKALHEVNLAPADLPVLSWLLQDAAKTEARPGEC